MSEESKRVIDEHTKKLAETLRGAADLVERDGVSREEYTPLIMGMMYIITSMLADTILGAVAVCMTKNEDGEEVVSQVSFTTDSASFNQWLALAGRLHVLSDRISQQAVTREERQRQEQFIREMQARGKN